MRVCHLKNLRILEGRSEIDCNLESGVSGPLRIAGRPFEHGIHVYAPSKVRLDLHRKYRSLEAWIGIDDWVGSNGAVRFHVTGPAGAARISLWERLAEEFPDETLAPRDEMGTGGPDPGD